MQWIDGFPRRSRIDCHTPAEAAIRAAIQAVEEVGAHELLTDAVDLLAKAQDKVADFVELPDKQSHCHTCHCGTAKQSPHQTGTDGCVRFIAESPLPTASGNWIVNGNEITDFTLRRQRGYHQHPCGCWSTHGDSVNSLECN
jgi:hypothetical protein